MPTVMLSQHFSLNELCFSQTASRMGIDNTPDKEVVACLTELAGVLEKVRSLLGDVPVLISSGYRCPDLNEEVGGAENSAHMYGYAADFTVPGFGDPLDVCKAIEPYMASFGIDQLINELDWIHLGLVAPPAEPRCECLTIDDHGTRYGFG